MQNVSPADGVLPWLLPHLKAILKTVYYWPL
jgi:hypothetical protein